MTISDRSFRLLAFSVLLCYAIARMEKSFKKVAVVGGGFAGLATACHLRPYCKEIDVYDTLPPGKASGSSAAGGLLHPFAPRGNLLWQGEKGFDTSLRLLEVAQEYSKSEIYQHRGISRPILSQSDWKIWVTAINKLGKKDWIDCNLLNDGTAPSSHQVGEVIIQKAIIVNSPKYLLAMWEHIKANGHCTWKTILIEDITHLLPLYDCVIVAAGAASPFLWPNQHLKTNFVKGSNLLYHYKDDFPFLSHPLLNGEYVVPLEDRMNEKRTLLCGATHEHVTIDNLAQATELNTRNASSPLSNHENDLVAKLHNLWPPLSRLSPVYGSSGVRLVTTRTNLGRLPIVGRHPDISKLWILSGLGSRGLIYHALMSEYLTKAIVHDDEQFIPECLKPSQHT